MAKITDEMKKNILNDISAGMKYTDIASKYGITRKTVYKIYDEATLQKGKVNQVKEAEPGEGPPEGMQLTPEGDDEISKSDIQLATMPPHGKPILEAVIRNLSWWQEAVQKIGFHAVMITMQARRMNVENIAEELKGFKSADEFVHYVDEYLTALLQSQTNADALIIAERKVKSREVAMFMIENERDKLKSQLDNTMNMLNVAIQYMPRDKLQALLMSQVLTASIMPSTGGEDHKEAKGA